MRLRESFTGGATILGFSGLPLARAFKKNFWPELTENELNITQGADAAAALIVGEAMQYAAAEERFDGEKHSAKFPSGAIRSGLQHNRIGPKAVDVVAHAFSFSDHRDFFVDQPGFYRELYLNALDPAVNQRLAEEQLQLDLNGRFVAVPHHLAHAMSAYVPSGFSEALVVVSDGLGERHSSTAYVADANHFQPIETISAANSLGLLYGLFTIYLGFAFGDGEYKVMGLAPYGKPERYGRAILDRWLHLEENGRYSVPLLRENITDLDKETYRAALMVLEAELGPRRQSMEPIEQHHKDIAAGLQAAVQAAQIHFLSHLRHSTKMDRLCLAGGVALNCVANGLVLRSKMFSEMYVQPASGDDGAALGAALHAARLTGSQAQVPRGSAFGPSYDDARLLRALSASGIEATATIDDDATLCSEVSTRLAKGAIVGWYQGRMEFGPRALGNRSILGDARDPTARQRINSLVKKREAFRPFAPIVPMEDASKWFEIDPLDVGCFENMLFVTRVRQNYRELLPATTHVDGSARVQTVSQTTSPLFWGLLQSFGKLTGVPVLLNTSFNVAGQPIVRTPEQAVQTFLKARLDVLVLGRYLVEVK